MRISYRVCDICGQKLTDGCVIDVRFRTVKDGKNAQAQRCIDMCDGCFNEIKNRLDAVDAHEGSSKMPMNYCRWLDRNFENVCRNYKTHQTVMRLDDGTFVLCEPTCKRCEGCGYEPITPQTPAWDDDWENEA